MAGPWLKMECATPDKPEVLAITAALGWDDPDLTVGKLFKLWRWFDQQTVDGNAKSVTPALLDRVVGVTGFVEAVASVGWLSVSSDGICLSNFDLHNGATAKARAETARRVAKHKAGKAADVVEEDGGYVRLSIPKKVRQSVIESFGGACVYCSRPDGHYTPPEMPADGVLHIDHVIPVSRGGAEDPSNYVPACRVCNMYKADRTPDECGFEWPTFKDGTKVGNKKRVTKSVPRGREEKEKNSSSLRSEEGARRATRKCPDSFAVTSDLEQWAAENAPGVDLKRETDKFRDHTFKTAYSDWDGTWRNWIRRASESIPRARASPPASETAYQRSMRERVASICPSIAAKPPNHSETFDVTTKTLGREDLREVDADLRAGLSLALGGS